MNALASIKTVITNFSFGKNADLEDMEPPVRRYTPKSINELCKLTKYRRREVQLIYRSFKQECPTGIVAKEKFKELYSQFFPVGDADQYAGFVFSNVDKDGDGFVTFEEFIVGMSVMARGTIEEKVRWVFNLYDLNGDGYISQDEMHDVLSSVYTMLGRHTIPTVGPNTVRDHVLRVFAKMDLNGDGKISFPEFLQVCKQDPQTTRSFHGMFDSMFD